MHIVIIFFILSCIDKTILLNEYNYKHSIKVYFNKVFDLYFYAGFQH